MKLFSTNSLRIILVDLVVWTLALLFFVVVRFGALQVDPLIQLDESFSFKTLLLLTTEAGLMLGLIYGIVDIFLDLQWMQRQAFGRALLIKGLIHFLIILLVSVVIRVRAFEHLGIERNLSNLAQAVLNPGLLVILLYTTIISFLINFIRQINLKLGPGNLTKFITGKFHRPQEEQRVFMFLDLRSSTTIAENLGHIKFSQLLQDCFHDLTVVRKHQAEVYQYVGDEAILTWEHQSGLANCNCLWAFKEFRDYLQQRVSYYQARYGLLPEFKAGINIGNVTVAEVGSIKREIAFHGDTLNTAARIQDQCNTYQKDLLISEQLHQLLPQHPHITRSSMGSFQLKGKQQQVGIYAVEFDQVN